MTTTERTSFAPLPRGGPPEVSRLNACAGVALATAVFPLLVGVFWAQVVRTRYHLSLIQDHVLWVACIACYVAAPVLGTVALVQARGKRQLGSGAAVAAIVTSILFFCALGVLLFFKFVVGPDIANVFNEQSASSLLGPH
jgi:cytochrome bd-type quinol oxidase subunit 2